MRKSSALFVFTLMLASAMAACGDVRVVDVVLGTDAACSDGVPISQAKIYVNETFYMCGRLADNTGGIANAVVSVYAKEIIDASAQTGAEGRFSFPMHSQVMKRETEPYYFVDSYFENQECNRTQLETQSFRINFECSQLPPTSVRVIPDKVEENKSFAIEVKGLPEPLTMIVLMSKTVPIVEDLTSDWSNSYPTYRCCEIEKGKDSCTCELQFNFFHPKHKLCVNNKNVVKLEVYKPKRYFRSFDIGDIPGWMTAAVLVCLLLISLFYIKLMKR